MTMNTYEETLQRAGRKLNFARNSLMGVNSTIRNDNGYQMTCARITSSIENLLNSGLSDKYTINEALMGGYQRAMNFSRRNFSASDLQTVQDCDVVDIAIAATVASHGLTYIAMERPMEAVRQEISFQGLKALNDAAGYSKGDIVFDPRLAISPELDLGQNSGAKEEDVDVLTSSTSDLTNVQVKAFSTLDAPVILGTTKVTVSAKDSNNAVYNKTIAFDPKDNEIPSSGIIPLVLTAGGFINSANVNIETGEVTLNFATTTAADLQSALVAILGVDTTGSNTITDASVKVMVCVDRVAESNGAHTLKLTPFVDSKTLVAENNRIVLQSQVEVQAQMNKILRKNAQYGIDTDFGKRAIDQIIALYTYYIDTNIVKALWNGISHAPVATLDLSSFGDANAWGYNANVKNDAIGLFTNDLCQAMLSVTAQPVTALIVDNVAALMYMSDKESFVPDPAALQRRDGFIGTYMGIPVVRNYWLNGKAGNTAGGAVKGCVIGVFKSPDGQAAPVAFGDYLPPYSTLPALNPENPGDLSQALFSSTGTKCVCPGWAAYGEVVMYGRAI